MGGKDKATQPVIGESDRMPLRFVKLDSDMQKRILCKRAPLLMPIALSGVHMREGRNRRVTAVAALLELRLMRQHVGEDALDRLLPDEMRLLRA